MSRFFLFLVFLSSSAFSQFSYASGTMTIDAAKDVPRAEITSDAEKEKLSVAAGLLADYEFAAKKLVDSLNDKTINAEKINYQANKLLTLSEDVIDSARFRLPQCDEYLAKTLILKDSLKTISHDSLENDYHRDGALPKAPGECYHTKDLFVHPATVIVLTRDDPGLGEKTIGSINAEITEVLAHTEVVRQLVIY